MRRIIFRLQSAATVLLELSRVYETSKPFTIRRGLLPPGDAGVYATLGEMRKLARAGATEPAVKTAALGILNRAGVAGGTALRKLGALFQFVRDEVAFTRDAIGVEVLQSPRFTLCSRSGDCDDKAILLAGLAHAAGLPGDYRFRVIGADRARPGRFSHVYVVVRLAGRLIALDPTYGTNRFGWEYPNASRMGELPA